MPTVKRRLAASEISTLQNICMIASETFREDVNTFVKTAEIVDDDEGALITREGALRMADQFRAQAQQAEKFMRLFSAYPDVDVTLECIDPDDEELLKL